MRLSHRLVSIVSGLVFAGSIILPIASVGASPSSNNLEALVGRSGGTWGSSLAATPGETINMLMTYTNTNKPGGQKYVVSIKDVLPSGATFKPGSAYLFNPSAPGGVRQLDTVTTNGISTGMLKPGEKASVEFQMALPAATGLACGNNTLINRVDATSRNGNKASSATTRIVVRRDCTVTPTPAPTPPTSTTTTTTTTTSTTSTPVTTVTTTQGTPKFGCGQGFTFYKSQSRTARIRTFDYVATGGAAYNRTDLNWGDQSSLVTVTDPAGLSHAYGADGTYTITATLHFTVNGQDMTKKCKEVVRVKAKTPTTATTTTTSTAEDTAGSDTTILIIAPVSIEVTEINNAAPAPQVASATTTATTAKPAVAAAPAKTVAADNTSAKSLPNTGSNIGTIFAIFVVASVVGAVGSRLALYRLLGA